MFPTCRLSNQNNSNTMKPLPFIGICCWLYVLMRSELVCFKDIRLYKWRTVSDRRKQHMVIGSQLDPFINCHFINLSSSPQLWQQNVYRTFGLPYGQWSDKVSVLSCPFQTAVNELHVYEFGFLCCSGYVLGVCLCECLCVSFHIDIIHQTSNFKV